ncbi:MAG: hypothetical protein IJQ13_04525 [Prevotella sp.]|nr:hypothetical protein [Prevotella sp.]
MKATRKTSSVQLSLFPIQGTSVIDAMKRCIPTERVSNYLKSREALWRLLATYPKGMPVEDAVRRARIDFTRSRKEVAA